MNEKINLKEMERRAFVSYHRDGLIDLFLGFLLMVSVLSATLSANGVADSVRIAIYVPLMVVIGPVLYMVGKRYITIPRLGYVKFGPERRSQRKLMTIILVHVVLLTLVIWTYTSRKTLGYFGSIMGTYGMSLIIVLIIMAFFSFAVYLTDYKRLYILGLIVAGIEPLHIIAERNFDPKYVGLISSGIPGLILLVMGGVTLIQFLHKYEKIDSEVEYGK
ncbi:MAG: hypothetical protein ACOY90_09885 [Candidatus Zhuqueibacterota bacterium]